MLNKIGWMNACLLSLSIGAAGGCAASHGGTTAPTATTKTTPSAPVASKQPRCNGCEKRLGGCMQHGEGGIKDEKGKPMAPTEGFDFRCDPSCCE